MPEIALVSEQDNPVDANAIAVWDKPRRHATPEPLERPPRRPDEALCRLRAGEQVAGEGWRSEADEQFERALAFYCSVGATRYIRKGDTLLGLSAA